MRLALTALCLAALPANADPVEPDWLDTMPRADVVFLGEVHDNPAHHQHQTRAIETLQPRALVFEMLTQDQAARIPHPLPDEDSLRAMLDWDESGWPDFALYYPQFAAAPEARIYGAELPRREARAAMEGDIAAHFPGDAARFGLTAPLPPEQQSAREELQARAHCDALPDHLLPGMVAIQRLRDALLAEAALRAHEDTGGPVAVITGTGHARTDWGAPYLLNMAAPELDTLALGQFEIDPGNAPPHDVWIETDPHPRPDPCEAFQ